MDNLYKADDDDINENGMLFARKVSSLFKIYMHLCKLNF